MYYFFFSRKAAGIPPTDELELDKPSNEPGDFIYSTFFKKINELKALYLLLYEGNMEQKKSSREQYHVTVATSPSPEPENV